MKINAIGAITPTIPFSLPNKDNLVAVCGVFDNHPPYPCFYWFDTNGSGCWDVSIGTASTEVAIIQVMGRVSGEES